MVDEDSWVRVTVAGEDYDGELVAQMADAVVVHVVHEHAFAGTYVFRRAAIETQAPPPHPERLRPPIANWSRRAPVFGEEFREIIAARPSRRLVAVQMIDDNEVCWIGRPTLDGDTVRLDTVDPSGMPDDEQRHPIDQIAHIRWGGGYMGSLEEIARPGTLGVDAFAAAVRGFFTAFKAGDPAVMQQALAELHRRALGLPDWSGHTDEPPYTPTAPGRSTVPNLLYWDLFDPLGIADSPARSLHDDLGIIWKDLVEGMVPYQLGATVSACEFWRQSHTALWGEYCVKALTALHLAKR